MKLILKGGSQLNSIKINWNIQQNNEEKLSKTTSSPLSSLPPTSILKEGPPHYCPQKLQRE